MNPKMPSAKDYADELLFMPWGKTIARVTELLVRDVPRGGRVLDVACGAGMLLGALHRARPDLRLVGVDASREYIAYARGTHSRRIRFVRADALAWNPDERFDAVICTGAIHHIPWRLQEKFLRRMAGWMRPGGMFVSADPCLGSYRNETERRLAAAELGHAYLVATIRAGATDEVTRAAVWLIENDVFASGEWKVFAERYRTLLRRIFPKVRIEKMWPAEGNENDYGDYVAVAKP